jgi:hypothetical protein
LAASDIMLLLGRVEEDLDVRLVDTWDREQLLADVLAQDVPMPQPGAVSVN